MPSFEAPENKKPACLTQAGLMPPGNHWEMRSAATSRSATTGGKGVALPETLFKREPTNFIMESGFDDS